MRTPLLEFEDLVEGVVKNAIDDFSAVVDDQFLEEDLDPGLLAVVIQAGPKSRKIAEGHKSLVENHALVLGVVLQPSALRVC